MNVHYKACRRAKRTQEELLERVCPLVCKQSMLCEGYPNPATVPCVGVAAALA